MIRPLDGPGKQTVKTTRSLALFFVRLLRKPHGRRGKGPENSAEPESAMERLRRYLAKLEEIEQSRAIALPPDAPVPVATLELPPEPPDQPTPGG